MPDERRSLRLQNKTQLDQQSALLDALRQPKDQNALDDDEYLPNGDTLLKDDNDDEGQKEFEAYLHRTLSKPFSSKDGLTALRMIKHALNSPLKLNDFVPEYVHRDEENFISKSSEEGMFSENNYTVEGMLLDRLVLHGLSSFDAIYTLISRTNATLNPGIT